MRGPVAAILISGLAGTTLCYGAGCWLAHTLFPGLPNAASIGAGLGFGALLAGMTAFILYPTVSKEASRLRESLAPGKSGETPSFIPKWYLRPIADTTAFVAKAWSARCDELTGKFREVEIRYKVADAERQHSEGILHSLRDAVLVTDSFNELTLANETAARLLGFDIDDAVHKSIDEVITDPALRQMIKEVRSAGVANKERHVEHHLGSGANAADSTDKHGHSPCFDVTLAALPSQGTGSAGAQSSTNQEANVGGVVTILRDITREKEISQMKSDFVSQASHELRTPISAINAYTEMLLDSEAQDEAGRQEFYRIIKGEAERLSRMIDNMLNISRIEAGIVSVERTEVDFVKVMQEVIETMQAPSKEKDIMLVSKSGPLIYTAEADHDLIYQVIMNLVSNAIKYTPAGGRVTLSVENDDASRSVLVTIADTGLGIPPDSIDKIFDKFYRIDNYKRVAKGTGLGLNLVKHIVETVHHGKVGVTSEVGLGSKFWFTIPYEYRGAQ